MKCVNKRQNWLYKLLRQKEKERNCRTPGGKFFRLARQVAMKSGLLGSERFPAQVAGPETGPVQRSDVREAGSG